MPIKRNSSKFKRLSSRQVLVVCLVMLAGAALLSQLLPHESWVGEGTPATPVDAPLATNTLPLATPGAATATAAQPTLRPAVTATRAAGLIPTPTAEKMSSFDYFVLSLSWSPDYCATSGGDDPQQCSIGRRLGFVLHGLWPQNNQGYPSDCTSEKLPQSVQNQFTGLYPNDALFDHEWEKHGTCTGLAPARYLTMSKQIKESVTIPAAYKSPESPFRTTVDQLKQEFAKANPSFSTAAFEVNCSGSGRYLKELYVCFSRAGQPTPCGTELHKDALKSCQAADFQVRNVR